MKIEVTYKGDVKVIRIDGEITIFEMEKLKDQLQDSGNCSEVHVDLTDCSFASTSFVNLIFEAKNKFKKNNVKFKISNPNSLVLEMLKIMQLEKEIEIVRWSPGNS